MPITIDGTGTITGATTLASTVASPTFTTPALGTPASGALTNCTLLPAGQLTGAVSATSLTDKIQPITASAASNALTITLNPTVLDFRASPITSGTVTSLVVSAAISVVIPSTSTMGTVSAVQSRIVVIAINNAGTVELAATNISGGSVLDETTLINTTAAAAAGNSATAYYSTTARTGVAYRVVGYIESTQATAGTWATAPSTIQGYGGQALSAMSSLGYSQTWQNVTGSRAASTTYYNTTGKPIDVNIQANIAASGNVLQLTINGIVLGGTYSNVSVTAAYIHAIVPVGGSYSLGGSSTPTVTVWSELR